MRAIIKYTAQCATFILIIILTSICKQDKYMYLYKYFLNNICNGEHEKILIKYLLSVLYDNINRISVKILAPKIFVLVRKYIK